MLDLSSITLEDEGSRKGGTFWPYLIPQLYTLLRQAEKAMLQTVLPRMLLRDDNIGFGGVEVERDQLHAGLHHVRLADIVECHMMRDSLWIGEEGNLRIRISLKKVQNCHLLYGLLLARCSNLKPTTVPD
jgi:hypothetical protein